MLGFEFMLIWYEILLSGERVAERRRQKKINKQIN